MLLPLIGTPCSLYHIGSYGPPTSSCCCCCCHDVLTLFFFFLVGKRNSSGRDGFEQEFQLLVLFDQNNIKPCSAAFTNNHLNRYVDILPYDIGRVSVPRPSRRHDYINASFVTMTVEGCPTFICAQGPMQSTRGDFWAMVIQRNIKIVVMLTNLVEGNRSLLNLIITSP